MFHYVCNVKVNIFNLQLKKHIMKLNEQLSKLKQTQNGT
jgi:hypothetical protein